VKDDMMELTTIDRNNRYNETTAIHQHRIRTTTKDRKKKKGETDRQTNRYHTQRDQAVSALFGLDFSLSCLSAFRLKSFSFTTFYIGPPNPGV